MFIIGGELLTKYLLIHQKANENSYCKLSWWYYCDVGLCYSDIRYHGSMQSYIFVKQ